MVTTDTRPPSTTTASRGACANRSVVDGTSGGRPAGSAALSTWPRQSHGSRTPDRVLLYVSVHRLATVDPLRRRSLGIHPRTRWCWLGARHGGVVLAPLYGF